MPWGAAIGAVGAIGGGLAGSMGAQSQVRAMREAIQLDRDRYEDTKKNLGPYVNFGRNQLNHLSRFLSTKNPMDFKDPGYDFRFEEGRKGLVGSAAASGMLQSGDTLRGLVKYGQDMGSSEYGNAFNRYLSEGNFLHNLAGMGQNAATGLGYLGSQSSANIANATSNAGYGDSERVWGDVAGGVGGVAGNAFKKYLDAQKSPKSSVGGPSIFGNSPANDVMMA